jgi:hypothetical protein
MENLLRGVIREACITIACWAVIICGVWKIVELVIAAVKHLAS